MSNYMQYTTTGSFTSAGNNVTLQFPQGVDWIEVYNVTEANGSQTTALAVKFYWQATFAQNAMWSESTSNAANATNLLLYSTSGGFSLVDSSLQNPGVINATITAVSAASTPVVSNSGTNGLVAGSIVRIYNVAGAQQLGGIDFTVGLGTLTSGTFSLDYMSQIVAGTTGSWALIPFDPIFYPRHRYITKITQAAQAVVTLSVTHGYQVGQAVRFNVDKAFGMKQINGLQGDIVAINTSTNTITVDINTTGFTPFVFPLTAAVPYTPALVVPIGEDTALALSSNVNILSDATLNTGYVGIILTGGAGFPGGASSDVLHWRAGTSYANNGI